MTKLAALEQKVAVHEQKFLAAEQKKNNHQKHFDNIGNKQYFIDNQNKMNWFAAKHRCQELAAHLVSIQNEAEYKAVTALIDKGREYWIDINDLVQEGLFLSDSTGRKAGYLNWSYAQPDNWNNVEHCVHLKNDNFQMNDADCKNELYIICEV
ncbi:C-type lectin 37Db-like [Drosophila hydei]|uniref:C-type lectin 37Db-like n=1 Tax=Drosophila hydei TaxID=7224 RepID=A0A6J2STC3_DROHY|nr:C-type lectin 37Db-like [Drosophila hydei]